MSKAYEVNLDLVTMKNEATSTIKAYKFCRLCTTADSVDLITTRGTVAPFGVAQTDINPSETGKIAVKGISRLKMGSTGYTTMSVTIPMQIGANASGCGIMLTTSVTLTMAALGLSTFAASDIIAVHLDLPAKAVYRT